MSTTNQIPGGWSLFASTIDQQAKIAFEEAIKNLLGVKYTPFAVQQQVVAGMNYVFLCNGDATTFPPLSGLYALHIYKPLTGTAVLTRIVHVTAY